jgi:hypothetical protein
MKYAITTFKEINMIFPIYLNKRFYSLTRINTPYNPKVDNEASNTPFICESDKK